MNRFAHTCGSSISVVNAPSSLLRERYPSSRATISSMRTRPKPCPSPFVVRKRPPGLFQLLSGGEVCEGDIKLRALHVHVHADEPVLFRQGHACFNGIIEEIAENAAEIELRHFELYGDVRVGLAP